MLSFIGYVATSLGWLIIVLLLLAGSLYILSLLVWLLRYLAFLYYDHAKRPWRTVMARKYTHVKRGTSYVMVGSGRLQTSRSLLDMDELVAYRDENTGEWWFRPPDEFEDEARFNYEGVAK